MTSRRGTSLPVDLGVELYERDRDAFASMLGSAIALRLFLFMIPAMLLVVGALGVILGADGVKSLVDVSGASGTIATQLTEAARRTHHNSWALLVIGALLTPWAGRSLTLVLSACSAGAWRIAGRQAKVSLRSLTTVTALLLITVATTLILNSVRSVSGVIVPAMSIVGAACVLGLSWFAVTWSLPRGTRDPGALLPGAVLVGAVMGTLQWLTHFYLSDRIGRSSEVMGAFGVSVAILGYLFLVGRVMAASLVLDAVVFERLGSISGVIFGLPGLRQLPRHSPRLTRFFALDEPRISAASDPDSVAGPSGHDGNP